MKQICSNEKTALLQQFLVHYRKCHNGLNQYLRHCTAFGSWQCQHMCVCIYVYVYTHSHFLSFCSKKHRPRFLLWREAIIWTLQSFYHHCDVTCMCVVGGGTRAGLLYPSPHPLPAPLHNLPNGVFTLTAALSPWLRRPARQLQTEIRTCFIPPPKHFFS